MAVPGSDGELLRAPTPPPSTTTIMMTKTKTNKGVRADDPSQEELSQQSVPSRKAPQLLPLKKESWSFRKEDHDNEKTKNRNVIE
mmetsp:Transcript_38395/g.57929  ORF Transcript_38395/g.57929 Transcript_38395/m.57929 type:complete len:85 (-) Transcript_38395:108-362(-)